MACAAAERVVRLPVMAALSGTAAYEAVPGTSVVEPARRRAADSEIGVRFDVQRRRPTRTRSSPAPINGGAVVTCSAARSTSTGFDAAVMLPEDHASTGGSSRAHRPGDIAWNVVVGREQSPAAVYEGRWSARSRRSWQSSPRPHAGVYSSRKRSDLPGSAGAPLACSTPARTC